MVPFGGGGMPTLRVPVSVAIGEVGWNRVRYPKKSGGNPAIGPGVDTGSRPIDLHDGLT